MHQFIRFSSIALTFLCSAGVVSAQPASPDAIAELRQALKAPVHDGDGREQAVQKAVADLRGLGELRRGLFLQEWRDEDADTTVAVVDQRLKGELQKRFEQAVRDVFAHGEATSQAAVVDMIGDLGVSICAVGGRTALATTFSADLATLIQKGAPPVHLAAVRALGQIHPDVANALPALAAELSAADESQRQTAAGSLAALVKVAGQVASHSHLPGTVAGGTDDLTGVVQTVLPLADKEMSDSSAGVRRRAIETIGWSVSSVNSLVGEQGTVVSATGTDMATALRPLLLLLKDQGPTLAHGLGDADAQVRAVARRTLEVAVEVRQHLQKQAEAGADDPLGTMLTATVPALTAGIADPDWHARQTNINILEQLGSAAAPASKALVQALGDQSRFVRWAAVRAVAKLGAQSAGEAVPGLVRLLGDADLDLILAAANALEQYGPAAAPAAAALAQLARSGDTLEARLASIRALERIGTGAAGTSVPTFTAALADPEVRVRTAAALALGQMGAAANSAVEALRRARGDSNPEVQKAADEALLRIVTAKP